MRGEREEEEGWRDLVKPKSCKKTWPSDVRATFSSFKSVKKKSKNTLFLSFFLSFSTSINVVLLVERLQTQDDLSSIKFRLLLSEGL